jgi:type IV pilus assembly protein PilF
MLGGCASSSPEEKQDLAAIYTDIGLSYLQRGDYPRAKEKLQRALEVDPKSARAHHYIAELYNRTEDYEKAELHFRLALESSPDDPNLRNNLGAFYCDRGRFDDAEPQFLAAIKDPAYTTPQLAFENLGRCALRKPDKAKAERYFTEALRRQPDLPYSLFEMAQIYFDRGEGMKARAFLERYFSVAAEGPEVLWLGVQIERALGDDDMAQQYGDKLRTRFPDAAETAKLTQMQQDKAPLPEAGATAP